MDIPVKLDQVNFLRLYPYKANFSMDVSLSNRGALNFFIVVNGDVVKRCSYFNKLLGVFPSKQLCFKNYTTP
jgi:hypothetical protein